MLRRMAERGDSNPRFSHSVQNGAFCGHFRIMHLLESWCLLRVCLESSSIHGLVVALQGLLPLVHWLEIGREDPGTFHRQDLEEGSREGVGRIRRHAGH